MELHCIYYVHEQIAFYGQLLHKFIQALKFLNFLHERNNTVNTIMLHIQFSWSNITRLILEIFILN